MSVSTNQFYIVTGLSGAGKSQALKVFEDFGFFCVDNLPIDLLPKFVELRAKTKGSLSKIAIGIDIRAGEESLASLENVLAQVKKRKIDYKVIYFAANDATLINRYSETRRKHPLGSTVSEGIKKERKLMQNVLAIADKEIDTSYITLGELKALISRELGIADTAKTVISVVSFGYKYGIPIDSDIVMDVRFLPNPNYIPTLRHKTGMDNSVKKYINKFKDTKDFLKRFLSLIDFLVPGYINEGKSYLTIAFGCTGGRHRSVMMAEETAKHLKKLKYSVHTFHRDAAKNK